MSFQLRLLPSNPDFLLLQNGKSSVSSGGNIRGPDKTCLRASRTQWLYQLPCLRFCLTSLVVMLAPGSDTGTVWGAAVTAPLFLAEKNDPESPESWVPPPFPSSASGPAHQVALEGGKPSWNFAPPSPLSDYRKTQSKSLGLPVLSPSVVRFQGEAHSYRLEVSFQGPQLL